MVLCLVVPTTNDSLAMTGMRWRRLLGLVIILRSAAALPVDFLDSVWLSQSELVPAQRRALAFGTTKQKSFVASLLGLLACFYKDTQIALTPFVFDTYVFVLLSFLLLKKGDYTQVPGECPATTTCPVVCVASADECPTACEEGLELCPTTGACAECGDDEVAVCRCDALPIACPKVVDTYDNCLDRFQLDYYSAGAACLEAQKEDIPQLSLVGPYFVAVYAWFGLVTAMVGGWCYFNEKNYIRIYNNNKQCPSEDLSSGLCSITTPTLPLQGSGTNEGSWTQTGYRDHWLGSLLYGLVVITFIGIQCLLFLLTIFYYMQQGAITRWAPVFQDEAQILLAFEVVWMVGITWCFCFQYPISVRTLLLRKCTIASATYVAVAAPLMAMKVNTSNNEKAGLGDMLGVKMWAPVDYLLRTIFSYPHRRHGQETTFCLIKKERETRFFYHRMRRYVYDESKGMFVPSFFSVGTTIGDLFRQIGGLSSDDASQRICLLGPNVIPISKPTILGSIVSEFSKGFYLYQNFMIWTWAPFWYYYMFVVNSLVRVTAGVVVAIFQHMSDSVMYMLARVEGEVE
jgi:hypothetical protein